MHFDVVVVGAGPSGSLAAQRLAEAGHSVALVDENDSPRCDVICSGIVSSEAFARFDLPTAAVLSRVDHARFYSPSGMEVQYRPGQPLAYVVDRTRFDAELSARAVAAGAAAVRGHRARSVRVTRRGVELMSDTQGGQHRLVGKILVVATGYRRRLHRQAGLGSPLRYVQGVHAEVPFETMSGAEVYFGRERAPGFFAWAVGLGPGKARVGLMTPQGGRELLHRFLAEHSIRRRLPEPFQMLVAGEGLNGGVMTRGIVQGPVRPSFAERVIAVGEAAGQIKTTTGGGLYYGMIGAERAAEVVDRALRRSEFSAGALGRYHRAWWGDLGREIRAGLQLQRLGAALEDHEIDDLFRLLQGRLARTIEGLLKFDWHRAALRALFRDGRLFRMAGGRG